jgi:lipoprotein-releasing system permease protein
VDVRADPAALSVAPARRGAPAFGAFERMVALRYLGATRRGSGVSFITVVAFAGIALSVATLIVVMSVMQGFRTTLLDQLLGVNGHVFVRTVNEDFADYEALTEAAAAVPGVTRATPLLRVPAGAVAGENLAPVNLIGIEREALLGIEEVAGQGRLLSGSFEGFGRGRRGGDEIALAVGLARALGVTAGDPVDILVAGGASTVIGSVPYTDKTYRVGAVFAIGNSQYDQVQAYIPLEQAQLLTRSKGAVSEVELRIADPQRPDAVRAAVEGLVGPGEYVLDWRDLNRDFFDALEIERAMVRIILSLLVLIAALLIVSNLVMLVKDKTSDIAVLRTMGATRGAILRVFFLSGMMIGVGGVVLGVILGVTVTLNITAIERGLSALFGLALFNPQIYYLDEIPAVLEWTEVRFVVLWTLALSAVASVLPARRAARLDPVEALRYE